MGCMACPFDSVTPSMATPWTLSQLYICVEGDMLTPRTEPVGHLKNIAFMTPCLVALFVCSVLPHVTMSRSLIICLQEVTIHIKLNCIKLLHKFSSCFHIVVDALYIQWSGWCPVRIMLTPCTVCRNGILDLHKAAKEGLLCPHAVPSMVIFVDWRKQLREHKRSFTH